MISLNLRSLLGFHTSKEKRKVLIIEGGGMRGIFTVGVLQSFADRNYFPWKLIAGSSAGALTGIAYTADQIHIARDVFFRELLSKDFINFRNFLKPKKHILNLDWLIDNIIDGEEPLNLKVLSKRCPVIITATQIHEKKPPETIFLNSKNDDIRTALKATAALPYLYRGFVEYKNMRLLDGAIVQPIPFDYIKSLGYKDSEITIILTRPKGYRKKAESFWVSTLYDMYYRDQKYRKLVEMLDKRYLAYNAFLDDLEKNHPELNIIYPSKSFKVDHLSKDMTDLMKGFQCGVKAGKRYLAEIGHIKFKNKKF